MPWLKRIDRQTGAVTRAALPDGGTNLQRGKRSPNPLGLRQFKGRVRVFAEAADPAGAASVWRASPADFATPSSAGSQVLPPGAPPKPRVVTLEHGSALDAGESGYLFLDRAEHRDATLEAAACASVEKVEPWAAWLEAQGDPFAGPLREMLAGREFVGRQRWWLEGCDRGMAGVGAAFEMRGGFLRRAELGGGTLPIDLQVLHLMGLRVARGLEDLTIDLHGFLASSFWLPFARSSFWDMAPWPASLRVVRLSRGAAKSPELAQSAAVLRGNPRMRGISIEA